MIHSFYNCSTTLPTHKYQTNPNQIIQIPTLSTTMNDPDSIITSWFCDCGVPLSNQNVTKEKGKENSRNWTKWIKFSCQSCKKKSASSKTHTKSSAKVQAATIVKPIQTAIMQRPSHLYNNPPPLPLSLP